MIARVADLARVRTALARSPVVLLVGPRQAGKSTLAREVAADEPAAIFDLENPRDAARLSDPMLALESLQGLVVIDEAQHAPELFPVLRVLADRRPSPARFLVLGSASPELVGLGAESLAGRVEIIELSGLRLGDVGSARSDRLWLQGSLPAAFTADLDDSLTWRSNYIATFLERDLAQLGFRLPASHMRRFWTMLAHYHAQTWNGSELARALGVSQPTTRRYLDALTDALVVRQLPPWYANIGKRVVRSPKVYIRDSGIVHALLGLDSMDSVLAHPKVGASWEGFVIEQISQLLDPTPLYFWGTQSGAELDLLFTRGGRSIGVEIKRTSSPRVTPSMRNAVNDLELDRIAVIHPGHEQFPLAPSIDAVPLSDLAQIAEF
ncbi:MAG: ATP-binding protein [Kineosporiaceae bacterium]|nr:ATP-binding protein [Kineosporiaceae bacterium]